MKDPRSLAIRCARSAAAFLTLVGASASSPALVHAHDFWIAPASFRPAVGEKVGVALRVGMNFQGEPFERKADRIDWFAAFSGQRRVEIDGAPKAEPAGSFVPDAPGTWVLGYRSRESFIELDGGKFEAYLKEEGLESIVDKRRERGESAKGAREIYSRCAKSLLRVGAADGKAGPAGGHDQRLGLPLELIPEVDPTSLAGRGPLPVRLLMHGKPLEGALVGAIDGRGGAASGRTDAAGRVVLELTGPGVWLVKTVHMFEAADRTRADWESLWATLTFEVPSP